MFQRYAFCGISVLGLSALLLGVKPVEGLHSEKWAIPRHVVEDIDQRFPNLRSGGWDIHIAPAAHPLWPENLGLSPNRMEIHATVQCWQGVEHSSITIEGTEPGESEVSTIAYSILELGFQYSVTGHRVSSLRPWNTYHWLSTAVPLSPVRCQASPHRSPGSAAELLTSAQETSSSEIVFPASSQLLHTAITLSRDSSTHQRIFHTTIGSRGTIATAHTVLQELQDKLATAGSVPQTIETWSTLQAHSESHWRRVVVYSEPGLGYLSLRATHGALTPEEPPTVWLNIEVLPVDPEQEEPLVRAPTAR